MLNKLTTIKCPIHGSIYLDSEFIRNLVDTKEFQRLRRISQIGGVTQLYPSATHTRFSHSLGVYEIMRKILRNYVENDFSEYEINLLLVTSLLHDLGHGPLSHTFELFSPHSHEYYTKKIILDENSEINKVLKNHNPKLINDIILVLEKKHPKTIFSELISSHIDVDRMDYLLRDSYHAGSKYGLYDIEWIIRCIRIIDGRLLFAEKGKLALENYLLCRYFAYEQIYLHEKSRGTEQHLNVIIKRLKDLRKTNYKFKTNVEILFDFFDDDNNLSNYLKLDDYSFMTIINNLEYEDDATLKNLTYLLKKHQTFIPINKNNVSKVKNKLISENKDPKYYLVSNSSSIKIYENYLFKNNFHSIRIICNNNEIKLLEEISFFAKKTLNKKFKKINYFSIYGA